MSDYKLQVKETRNGLGMAGWSVTVWRNYPLVDAEKVTVMDAHSKDGAITKGRSYVQSLREEERFEAEAEWIDV